MNKGYFITLLMVALITTCNLAAKEKFPYQLTDLSYRYLSKGKGESPVYGSRITVAISESDRDGKLFGDKEQSTYILGLDEQLSIWEELLLKLQVGDLVLAKLVSDDNASFYEGYYTVQLLEIASNQEKKSYDIPGKTRIKTDSGLEYIILTQGTGMKAAPGYTVTFHYTGFLEDETVFASSYESERPMKLILGIDPMIVGWYEGLCLMREGDQMRLIVPAELGYSEEGIPDNVPADAVLIFEIDLLKVE